jgi:hypothetical protein
MSATKTATKVKARSATEKAKSNTKTAAGKAAEHVTEEVVVIKRAKEAGDYFGSTLAALKKAPLAFVTTAILGGALGYSAALLNTEQSINLIGTQQPLTSAGEYAALSSRELRLRTINWAGQVRNFLVEWAIESSQPELVSEVQAASSAFDQQAAWEEYVANSQVRSQKWVSEYAAKFHTEASFLRAELLSRLGDSERDAGLDALYSNAENPVEIRQVLEDLGRLAENLISP